MAIDIDETKVERNEFGLWLGWTLATAIGMLIGYLPAALFVSDLDVGIDRVIVPLLAGLLTGIAQWLVLRSYVTRSHDWILYHAGGWVVGYALGLFVVQALAQVPFGGLIGFILFGIIVALFQWPVLRREIPHLLPWAIANIIGWTLGAFVSQLVVGAIFKSTQTTLVTSTLLSVGITGLIAGAIIAVALIWIVRQPERSM